MDKKKLILIAVVAAAGFGAYSYFAGSGDKKPLTNTVRISAASVVRQDLPQTLALVGNVIAYETVAVKSRLDSQVVSVAFKDGDNVQEGQVLFELDNRALVAQMKELEANLEKDRAQLVNSKLQYERSAKLVKSNTVAQSRVDETKAGYQAQVAQVASTQANLDNTRVMLSYTQITAPISGRAGTINVTRGNNVRAGDAQPLVTINRVTPIRAQFSIPQRYYGQVKDVMAGGALGVTAKRSESPDISAGTLEYLDNAVDTSTGTFAARAVFENTDEKLWPGMFVNVALDLGVIKDVLTVPAVAVQGDQAKHFVFVLTEGDKKVSQRPVEVGMISGDLAAIASGLTEGDKVATDGLLRLTDGASIEIAAPATTAPKEEEPTK